jgi:hypothetical protein
MKKFGFAAMIASGLTAAVLGFAAPSQAAAGFSTDVGHHDWVNILQPQVNVPHVDTTVQQSR